MPSNDPMFLDGHTNRASVEEFCECLGDDLSGQPPEMMKVTSLLPRSLGTSWIEPEDEAASDDGIPDGSSSDKER